MAMEQLQEECTNTEVLMNALYQHRALENFLMKKAIPFLENKLEAAEKVVLRWQERATKAENRIEYLERQLQEKERLVNHQKSVNDVQYQIMMKTGSVMGEVVWKSFKSHATIKMLVDAEETMDKYCAMSQGFVESFLGTYNGCMPPQKSLEHVFVISILGALTNFAAFSEGRAFLAKRHSGLLLMERLLQDQAKWSINHCRNMKRMVLTFVYNFSLVDNVAYFVLSEEKLLNAVLTCVRLNDSSDVVGVAVAIVYRLLTISLQAGIPSALPEKIPWSMVREMTASPDSKLVEIAKNLIAVMESGAGSLSFQSC
ncbi:uncharacterized protein LOC125954323 [Anopheles darlingi]|uniref:uncharacterized protein LOC125954323 n=1 Tax=Anopheles darlingi TaxID=43151 RepID=UPI002100588E|nr:uncharacterized protein LOC125954323 [Anopheles darlingi]